MKNGNILFEISEERVAQEQKWGVQDWPMLVQDLLERVPSRMALEYEIPSESRAKYLLNEAQKKGGLTYFHILQEEVSEAVECVNDHASMRKELIQVAAVAVAMIDCIDRHNEPPKSMFETIMGSQKLVAMDPERDAFGQWRHPALPEWGEGTAFEVIEAWFNIKGLGLETIDLESDDSESADEARVLYFEKNDSDLSLWTPTSKTPGAFLIMLHDTDTGPHAVFTYPL